MRTFNWHRSGDGRYESSDGRFTVEGLAGISAGFRDDGTERFVMVGWVLHDHETGWTSVVHTRLRDAKAAAEERATR